MALLLICVALPAYSIKITYAAPGLYPDFIYRLQIGKNCSKDFTQRVDHYTLCYHHIGRITYRFAKRNNSGYNCRTLFFIMRSNFKSAVLVVNDHDNIYSGLEKDGLFF
jgi:hypothetical protein